MSNKLIAKNQPSSFVFSEENKVEINNILKIYPEKKKEVL